MINLREVYRVAGALSGFTHGELGGGSRLPPVVRVRQRGMYLCTLVRPDAGPSMIGRPINRDRATVRYGIAQVGLRLAQGDDEERWLISQAIDQIVSRQDVAESMRLVSAQIAECSHRLEQLKRDFQRLAVLRRAEAS
ncbi:MAG TPA: hypothetical protein VMU59_14250 [Caulobacteraceae bacterium]|nr:hypothetical protein [Caulobacteraceae bacterium]